MWKHNQVSFKRNQVSLERNPLRYKLIQSVSLERNPDTKKHIQTFKNVNHSGININKSV